MCKILVSCIYPILVEVAHEVAEIVILCCVLHLVHSVCPSCAIRALIMDRTYLHTCHVKEALDQSVSLSLDVRLLVITT